MILHGENLDSAGPDDYDIQIDRVGRCVATLVTATEIHCQPDLGSITGIGASNIQVGYC